MCVFLSSLEDHGVTCLRLWWRSCWPSSLGSLVPTLVKIQNSRTFRGAQKCESGTVNVIPHTTNVLNVPQAHRADDKSLPDISGVQEGRHKEVASPTLYPYPLPDYLVPIWIFSAHTPSACKAKMSLSIHGAGERKERTSDSPCLPCLQC